MDRRGFGVNSRNFVKGNNIAKNQENNFDDVPLPAEVQRDLTPILPKSKFNIIVFVILVLVLILGGGIIYLLFFTDNDVTKVPPITSNKTNSCSMVDISVSSLSADTCYEQNESTLKVFVERGDNSYSLKSLIFRLYSSSGKKMIYVSSQVLQEGGKNTYSIDYSLISNVQRFEVIPTIQDSGVLKNCSRLVVSSVYSCKSLEENILSIDRGINISNSFNTSANNSVLTNTSSNISNNSVNLGGSSGYSSGSSSNGSGSEVNLSDYQGSSEGSSSTLPIIGYSSNGTPITTSSSSGSSSLGNTPATTSVVCTGQNSASIGISSCQDLQNMQNDLCGNYYLTKDIDCSATKTWNYDDSSETYLGFAPISTQDTEPFGGSLDGKGYKITNLYVNRPNDWYSSLLGACENAEVSNLGLINVNITSSWAAGALAGQFYNGRVTKVYSTGYVEGFANIGGLIGELGANVIVADGKKPYRPRGVGYVEKSYSSAKVVGYTSVGGFVGSTFEGSEVINCYATGNVIGDNGVGGFVGSANGLISKSYSMGNVAGDEFVDMDVDGFAGFSTKFIAFYGNNFCAGGCADDPCDSYSNNILVSYFDSQTSGQDGYSDTDSSPPVDDIPDTKGELKTTNQMKSQSTYSGWDFSTVWKMSGYPVFK